MESRGGVRRKYASPQSVKSEGLTRLAPPVLVSDHFVSSSERSSEPIEDPPSLTQPGAVTVTRDRQPIVVVTIKPPARTLDDRGLDQGSTARPVARTRPKAVPARSSAARTRARPISGFLQLAVDSSTVSLRSSAVSLVGLVEDGALVSGQAARRFHFSSSIVVRAINGPRVGQGWLSRSTGCPVTSAMSSKSLST